jgi:hypothetical protein
MNKRYFLLKSVPILAMVLGLSTTSNVFAADRYRVTTQVFHLGEVIAQPVIDVEVGKTLGGTYSVPGQAQYKIVVLIRPAAKDAVFVSMQFSSGKVNIQPNLLIDLGKETSVTIDKVRLNLLVKRISRESIEKRPVVSRENRGDKPIS